MYKESVYSFLAKSIEFFCYWKKFKTIYSVATFDPLLSIYCFFQVKCTTDLGSKTIYTFFTFLLLCRPKIPKKSIFCIFFNLMARIFKYELDDAYGIVLQYLKNLHAINLYFGPNCQILFVGAGSFDLESSWCTNFVFGIN